MEEKPAYVKGKGMNLTYDRPGGPALYQTNGENYFSEKYQYNNVYKSKFDRRLFEDRDKSYDRFRNPNDPHTRYMRQQNERQNKWQSERYRDKIGKYYDR